MANTFNAERAACLLNLVLVAFPFCFQVVIPVWGALVKQMMARTLHASFQSSQPLARSSRPSVEPFMFNQSKLFRSPREVSRIDFQDQLINKLP